MSEGEVNGAVRLENLPWPEVAKVQKERNCLLVPLGATEQHGPHLPINTDTVIADFCSDRSRGRAGDVLHRFGGAHPKVGGNILGGA